MHGIGCATGFWGQEQASSPRPSGGSMMLDQRLGQA
jgi:hypothetical protein